MKKIQAILSLLLTAVLIFTGTAGAFADGVGKEAAGFPAADEKMLENVTDSSKLPTYTDPADVCGRVSNEDADVIDSMISEEAKERFSSAIDVVSGFEPAEDRDVSLVLGRVEHFLSTGGLKKYLQSGNLLMGSEIGLTNNRQEKVKVLGGDSNAGGWVFVVDKDAMSWFVKGPDGMGVPNALVTISYLDASGRRVTKSVPATGGNTPGIAVFDELPDEFFGLVDIQAEGYRSVSILDKLMGQGRHFTVVLEEAEENEVYIRGVDLAGKDMVNEETKLSLVNMNTADLTLKVIVTKRGNAEFPSSAEIFSDSRGETILSIGDVSEYPYDSNTRVYTVSRRWAEQSAGLLKDGDRVSVRLGNEAFALEHVTVENAVVNPAAGETEVPVTTKALDGSVSDRMSGGGFLNQTMQMLKVPVSFGMFPDGTMILMASYDITQLDPNTQYKFSSLFEKSWNPKDTENLQDPLEIFEKSFWENTEKIKKGDKILESQRKIKCVSNFNYDFSMSFSLFLRSCYNKETNDNYGSGGILFSGSFTAGVTEYFLLPVGPVILPVYIGFEGHIAVKTALNVNFGMDRPPTGHDQDREWKYSTDDGTDVNARIEVIIGFSVFGGVGVKGVLGACATGYVDFDIATVIGKGRTEFGKPHSFIDVLYGLKIEYYILFYSGTVSLDCLNGAQRLADSNGEYDKLGEALKGMEFNDLSLADCAEKFVLQASAEDGVPHDEFYTLRSADDRLEGNSSIVPVDSSIYPDPQLQFAATKDCTALFRIASNGQRTDIYYQLQNRETGDLYSGLYKVRLPEGETRSVSEFVVVPNKTDRDDPENCNKVYIGAILADNTLTDENARMRSTDVASIVVDLDREYTVSSVIASDPEAKGQVFYSAPLPVGSGSFSAVAYAATRLRDDNGKSVDGLKALLGAVPETTDYYISWGADGNPAERSFRNLGRNKVYSTGVVAPNEPSFWTVDGSKSSDKYLYVKGYGANGYYEETLRCNFRIDIEGMVNVESIRDGTVSFDSIITNWQYLNGCSYFIAGDSVYWMSKKARGTDPSDYEWTVEKVINGSGVVSVDNRYAMITNNNQSAVYLIGVVGDYEVDVEAGTAEKGGNVVKIYTITTDRNGSGGLSCTLHGPLDLKFAKGEKISCFTAAYNPDECRASGLTVAYAAPAGEGSRYACNIKMWKQNADKGLLVTQVRIPDYLVLTGQPCIEAFVTVRNYGYGRENPVPYVVKDENGTRLMMTNGKTDFSGEGYFYTGNELYTGDTRVDRILIRPSPAWKKNEEHEIIVEVADGYRYEGSLDDVVNSAKMLADDTSLTARNALIGGRHVISTAITNNALVGEKTPIVRVRLDYGDPAKKARELRFDLPTKELLCRFDPESEEPVGRTYYFDVDMDGVWKDGLKDGLRGAYVSLVDAEGNRQSNEEIYLVNPADAFRTGKELAGPEGPDAPGAGGGTNRAIGFVLASAGLFGLAAVLSVAGKRLAKKRRR